MSHSALRTLLPVLSVAMMLLAAGSALAASRGQTTSPGSVVLTGAPDVLRLSITPADNGDLTFSLVSQSPGGCRIPPVFELPIQLDGTGFQLKRVVRTSQDTAADGTCTEGFATDFRPDDFRRLATAASVVLHLPVGTVMFPKEALAYTRGYAPDSASEAAPPPADSYTAAISRMAAMIRDGKSGDAVELADGIAPLFATRPASEGLSFFYLRGAARRAGNDLEGAAICYEIAARIAEATGETSTLVGTTYDNLATVRRMQRQWAAADVASDRALAVLEKASGPTSGNFGIALHNRAILLLEEEKYGPALEHEERALGILRDMMKDHPAALDALEQDRRLMQEKLLGK